MIIKSKLLTSLMGPLSYVEVTSDDARLSNLLANPRNVASLQTRLAREIAEGDIFDLEGVVSSFWIELADDEGGAKKVCIAWAVGLGCEFALAS